MSYLTNGQRNLWRSLRAISNFSYYLSLPHTHTHTHTLSLSLSLPLSLYLSTFLDRTNCKFVLTRSILYWVNNQNIEGEPRRTLKKFLFYEFMILIKWLWYYQNIVEEGIFKASNYWRQIKVPNIKSNVLDVALLEWKINTSFNFKKVYFKHFLSAPWKWKGFKYKQNYNYNKRRQISWFNTEKYILVEKNLVDINKHEKNPYMFILCFFFNL